MHTAAGPGHKEDAGGSCTQLPFGRLVTKRTQVQWGHVCLGGSAWLLLPHKKLLGSAGAAVTLQHGIVVVVPVPVVVVVVPVVVIVVVVVVVVLPSLHHYCVCCG
jgi:hypothetical protein